MSSTSSNLSNKLASLSKDQQDGVLNTVFDGIHGDRVIHGNLVQDGIGVQLNGIGLHCGIQIVDVVDRENTTTLIRSKSKCKYEFSSA